MKQATKIEINEIKNIFIENYSDAVTELNYKNLYELIIAVMLSAQCTDKRVNIITPALFLKYPDVKQLCNAELNDVKNIIKSCSFFNNKAVNLIKMANRVIEHYDGQIPLNEKDLITLAGVGQKTAHVVMIEYAGANLIAVDTHVFRVAHRLGLSSEKTAIKTEEELTRKFKTDLHILHQAMVLFGRYICKAISPKCETDCFLKEYCKTKKSFKVG
ncbi:MAG TPA: endonuclease III [Sulfurospirillum arcachonense]|nr:endonuclease III [Sulfurospirillum arcachonense]HIP44712.1 endonuclease III [Sulfurospirillum arcachonense]